MPEQVGRFRILSQLGKGGMGVVYLAEDPLLYRKVAIKMLDLSVDEGSQQDFLRDRLLRDARAAAILSHPNIVSIHDVIEEGGAAFVVMEYLSGESLAAYLKRHPLPEPAFVVKVLRAMAAGLDYTHGRGIIHRDIKPANAMFDGAGTLKILDFGIARMSDASTATPTGMVIGTVQYMAPEQIKGEPMDGRADQFSLAAVAYQMMTGSTLFGYHTLATLTYKIVNEMPPAMQSHNASLPATVDVVVAKALSKSPAGRFDTCTAFVDALEAALSGGGPIVDRSILPTQPLTLRPQPVQTPPVKPGLLIGIVAGIVALLAGGGFLLVRKPWARQSAPAAPVAEVTKPVVTLPPAVIPPQAEPAPAVAPPEEKLSEEKIAPEAAPSNPVPEVAKVPEPKAVTPTPAKKTEPAVAKARKKEPEIAPVPPLPPLPQAEVVEERAPDTDNAQVAQPAVQAYRQGRELLRAHNHPAAIQAFAKAIAIRPNYAAAYHYRGLAYQSLGQYQDAINDFSEAIRIRPEYALSYRDRGICEARLKLDDQALADFNRTIKLLPDSADASPALNGRGEIYMRRQSFNSALHDFNEAIRLSPNSDTGYQNRGLARHALGNEFGADADLRKAKELRLAAGK